MKLLLILMGLSMGPMYAAERDVYTIALDQDTRLLQFYCFVPDEDSLMSSGPAIAPCYKRRVRLFGAEGRVFDMSLDEFRDRFVALMTAPIVRETPAAPAKPGGKK